MGLRALVDHRCKTLHEYGLELIIVQNEDAGRQGINPFQTGSALYSQAQLNDPLKRALSERGFEAPFWDGRRHEKKARAKKKIFSFRMASRRGIRRTHGPNCGTCTTRRRTTARASRSRTGPSSMARESKVSSTAFGRSGAVALPGLSKGPIFDSKVHYELPSSSRCPRFVVSRTRLALEARCVCEKMEGELVPMGSARAKAMAVPREGVETCLHSSGQYEWISCARVAGAKAQGLHCPRIDGSPLLYKAQNACLPGLLV